MAEIGVQVCETPSLTASIQNITVIEGAVPYIGENGNWWVGEKDTGVSASASGAISPTVSITAIEGGHRITVTDANGTQSFDVADGHTPEVGVDYFTDADKAEIAALVIADIGSAEEGAY